MMIALSVVTYFLATNGKINNFPTYLAALAFIPFIAIRPGYVVSLSRPIIPLIIVFLLYLVLSATWSENTRPILVATYLGYAFLLASFVLGIGVISNQYPDFLKWLMVLTVLSATISCCFSIFLYFWLPDYHPLIEERLYSLGRLRNPVIGALSYGVAATICANLALVHARWMRFLWSACLAILLLGILFTETRSAWVGLIISIPACVMLQREISVRAKYSMLVTFFLILTVTMIATWLMGYWDEVLHRALSFRPEIWLKAVRDTTQENLILGKGIASSSRLLIDGISHHHPHSIYVSTFFYGGLTGALLLVTLISACLKELIKKDFTPLVILALSTLLYAVSTLMIDGNRLLEKIDFHWLVFWLPVALCLVATGEENSDIKL
jgi:O-antigen ligase|tara:strand:+ start:1874 stop:3022 length:1149 start_codon:yes stop_codon:yes gene_type:complete